ncbi:collectin-10 [Plakobranchus ocellatus]|uniref:Collectin-10 n=1 Tax=Plakobranchus ocellatus TaxID=259542 RepID=A0AAV4D3U3_9GAST|nr:collectin-10 [Plakobranchus ocellatus]
MVGLEPSTEVYLQISGRIRYQGEGGGRDDFIQNSACEGDFVLYVTIGKCVKASADRVTRHEALDRCSELGAKLMTVESRKVNSALSRSALMTSTRKGTGRKVAIFHDPIPKSRKHWISLNDIEKEGEFRWATHGHLAKWTAWDSDQPKAPGKDLDCVLRTGTGTWQMASCLEKHYFLCEKFLGQRPESPKMDIVYDELPSIMYSGGQLVVNCTGFVAYRGELRFQHNKPIPGDGASGFVILPDSPVVTNLEDGIFVVNKKTGACGRRSKASLKMPVTKNMDGATISCCAFLHDGFNECQHSRAIIVHFLPQQPNLTVTESTVPTEKGPGRIITAKCRAVVGSEGYLSWVIIREEEVIAVWILRASDTSVESYARPELFHSSQNKAGVEEKGQWMSSEISMNVSQALKGARIYCSSKKYDPSPDGKVRDGDADNKLWATSQTIRVLGEKLNDVQK